MKSTARLLFAFACTSCLIFSPHLVLAADRTWDGGDGSSNNWNVANNWDGVAPVANDSLIFAGGTRLTPSNNFPVLPVLTQFNGITFASDAGAFTLSGNSYKLGGNITNSSLLNLQTMGGNGFTLVSDIVVNTGAAGIAMSTTGAKIVGSNAIEKTGTGTWTLSANSDNYSGNITISQGTVVNAGSGSSAFGTGITTMANGTGVSMGSSTTGAIVGTGGVKIANSGTVTFAVTDAAGTVTMNGGTNFIGDASYGQGVTIIKTGDGNLNLKQTASTLGSTTASTFQVNAGKLLLDNGDQNLGDGKNDVVLNGGTLSVKNGVTFGANRTFTLNNVANNAIEVSVAGTSSNFNTVSQLTGTGGFAKTGVGSLSINATQNYTGSTTISAGTLILGSSGDISSSPTINLGTSASQGTLNLTAKTTSFAFGTTQTVAGFGTINIGAGKTVTVNGNLAPGNSMGVIAVTGNLTLASTATTTMELLEATQAAGTGFDQINIAGALVYGGILSIDLNPLTTQLGTYNLFDFTGGQSGTFSSISFLDAGATGTFNYITGELTLQTVPEPATWLLIALSGTFLIMMRRRRAN